MPGLPRKSTKNQFTKLLKKSGKSKTNTKSGATSVTKNISTIENKILNFEQFLNENTMSNTDEILKEPYDASSYQGTIVKVLPSEKYLKKYWNKKHYVERQQNINGEIIYHLQESVDGEKGWYGFVFCTDAKEHINFEFINGSTIYNNIDVAIGTVSK